VHDFFFGGAEGARRGPIWPNASAETADRELSIGEAAHLRVPIVAQWTRPAPGISFPRAHPRD
jgi:hypothetical protein